MSWNVTVQMLSKCQYRKTGPKIGGVFSCLNWQCSKPTTALLCYALHTSSILKCSKKVTHLESTYSDGGG
jgi:hypothetical protein